MKKTRNIIAAVIGILSLIINTMVCIQWWKQGCEAKSLVAAVIFYSSMCFALWFVIDDIIKDKNE